MQECERKREKGNKKIVQVKPWKSKREGKLGAEKFSRQREATRDRPQRCFITVKPTFIITRIGGFVVENIQRESKNKWRKIT